jgi:tetratricopeptide (TPR) repeat protein
MGLHREAQGYGEESLSIAREIGDKETVWMTLQVLGIAHSAQGDRAIALRHFEDALALARDVGPKRRLAASLHNLAVRHREEGDLETAEPLYVESLDIAREQGDRSGNTVATLCSLAAVLIERGSDERARGMLLEAVEIVEEIGSKFAGRQALDGSAALAAFLGDWEHAVRLHGAAAAQREAMGYHREGMEETSLAPLIARAHEAFGATECAAAEAAGRMLSYEAALAEARAFLERRS